MVRRDKDTLVNAFQEKGDVIRLVGRRSEIEIDWPDAFYVTTDHASKFPADWRQLMGEPDRGYVRVRWPDKSRESRISRLVYFNENVFQPRGISPLEADVSPIQRFLIENPTVRIAKDWKLLWYDLEAEEITNWDRPWLNRILSFSWRSSTGAKGHVRLEAKADQAERKLLEEFIRIADDHDILLAWNGSKFDDKMVQGRCAELNVPFGPELYHWLDHLWLFKRYFQRSEDGNVTASFRLDDVAAALLAEERKVDVRKIANERGYSRDKGDLFTWLWRDQPQVLREYNDQDVNLMEKVEQKTGFIGLHLAICELCRVLPRRNTLYPMTHIDGRMLQRGHAVGYHWPSRIRSEDDQPRTKARGAYVPEAVVGLHDSVAVLDFSRMYPSIILTGNMSLETLDPNGEIAIPETTPKGRPTGGIVARFRKNPEGHLPAALRGVLEFRSKFKKALAAAEPGSLEWHDAFRLSTACKILANVFYGTVLSPLARYYVHEIGEAITSFGRLLLASTIQTAENAGHPLVFGDTDSVAFSATDEQAEAIKDTFMSDVLPGIVEKTGADLGLIELGYEKRYHRIVVTASKRYAGKFAVYDGKPADPTAPFDVRGLEIVRSDVCIAARRLQRTIIEMALEGADANALWTNMRELRDDFIKGKTPVPDLVLRKGLTKQPREYKTKPLQAKVAEQMTARGLEVWIGSKIAFLMTDSGPIIPDDFDAAKGLDLQFYWNNQVYPPAHRVLEAAFPEVSWDSLRFERGYDPNQLTVFEPGTPLAKRPSPERAVMIMKERREQLGLFGQAGKVPAPKEALVVDFAKKLEAMKRNKEAEAAVTKPERPVRPAKKIAPGPGQGGSGPEKPTRPVRAAKHKGSWLVLTLAERTAEEHVDRIKLLLEEFPGEMPVKVIVEVRSSKPPSDVTLQLKLTSASPASESRLAAALRTLGVRWSLHLGG